MKEDEAGESDTIDIRDEIYLLHSIHRAIRAPQYATCICVVANTRASEGYRARWIEEEGGWGSGLHNQIW